MKGEGVDWDARLRAALDPVPETFATEPGLRNAAVLLPWFTRGDGESMLLTARPQTMAHHGGQVAFPGGKQEPDESPLSCALREAHEELGIEATAVEVLGALPARTSGAGFRVTCIVGRLTRVEDIRADPREIERVYQVPILKLADANLWYAHQSDLGRAPSPHFDLEGAVLWGLTARFLRDLLNRLGLLQSP